MLNVRKKISSAVMCSVLAGTLAFAGIASAFGETASEGVEIKEFSLLDTASDVVGAADFTPEGNKDGHFKLQLNLSQKTTIQSVVLRSTDENGKDNQQGVWRTNRVTTGWLLGIVQDITVTTSNGVKHETKIINKGFSKNIKDPVGEFEGELTFDLYASNNGTIKETQYYVLEIETPQGKITSKPIKYKKPMTSGGSSTTTPKPTPAENPKPIPTENPKPMPNEDPKPNPTPTPKPMPGSTVQVFYKEQLIDFGDALPVQKDGRTLVPFRKLFETFGFAVKWVDEGGIQKAIGTKAGLTIELTINSKTAKVNGSSVTLDVPAQTINGSTMVPLRFVSENSGYQLTLYAVGKITVIQIEDADPGKPAEPSKPTEPTDPSKPAEPTKPADPSKPTPSTEQAEPYVVKGYVRDANGNPLPGVKVFADNTLLYNSNIIGVTDENGHYRIELEKIATSWSMSAQHTVQYNGKKYTFKLSPNLDLSLTGSKGGVRDFTWKDFNGQIYIYGPFSFDDGLPDFNMTDLEITLTPVGPLLDGSAGKTITKKVGPVQGGLGLDEIPIGKYKATVRWLPEGHDPIPMQVRLNYIGKYADSAEFEFAEPRGTSTSKYLSELEVKLP